jgi:hypothetical protein
VGRPSTEGDPMRASSRSRLGELVRTQWAGLLALFLIIAGGTAYAANTIGSSDIIDESIQSEDIKNNEVATLDVHNNQIRSADVRDDTLSGGGLGSPDIADGQLNDEDIAQLAVVNFPADIGSVSANDCTLRGITGVGAQGDHLVLEPSIADMNGDLSYDAVYDPESEAAWLSICNPTVNSINDGITHFNLLVIDAQ